MRRNRPLKHRRQHAYQSYSYEYDDDHDEDKVEDDADKSDETRMIQMI